MIWWRLHWVNWTSPYVQFQHIPFISPDITTIQRSSNVSSSLYPSMKSSLVTAANPLEVVTVTVRERKQSRSAAASYVPWLSEASGICTPRILAAYALREGFLNKEFAVCDVLAKWSSVDLIGKLLKWCLLTWSSAAVCCLHRIA